MNNKKTSSKAIQYFAILWLGSLTLFALSFALKIEVHPIIQILLGLLVVAIAVIFARGGFHYIEVETTDENFKVKHFNLFPMGRTYKALQIPWGRYYKHEIKTSGRGLFNYLYIYEQTGRGLAKYPAIGLTALKKDEREEVINFFRKMETPRKK